MARGRFYRTTGGDPRTLPDPRSASARTLLLRPSLSASVGTTGNGNTYPQTYDALGRYVFLRATVDF